MTTINYRIGSHTGQTPTASNWADAQTLRETTMAQEIAQLVWWPITAVITNNDGTITMTSNIDSDGNPLVNVNGTSTVYVDTTTAPVSGSGS
jgi:hypothetical protein